MTLETFVMSYGYPALLVGALLEGETIVIIAVSSRTAGISTYHGSC